MVQHEKPIALSPRVPNMDNVTRSYRKGVALTMKQFTDELVNKVKFAREHAPFTIGYTFEGKPHDYQPDVVGT